VELVDIWPKNAPEKSMKLSSSRNTILLVEVPVEGSSVVGVAVVVVEVMRVDVEDTVGAVEGVEASEEINEASWDVVTNGMLQRKKRS
jgi:hypothetical protein